MHRREALVRIAGCTAGATFGWRARRVPAAETAPQRSAPYTLKYILASSLYGKTKLEEILPEVKKAGCREIDIWPEHHANQREQVEAMGHAAFRRLLERHGVRLGMTTRYDLGPLRLEKELRVLHEFGARLVVTGSHGPKNLSGAALKRAVKRFVEEMKPHVELAGKLGVTIGIENHANALLHTPESLRYFAELSPSPRLGIALAPYHLPQDAALLARLIADIGSRLVHFYAWQYGRGCMKKLPKKEELQQLPGRGTLDFTPILASLRKAGYKGWTEIFMHPVPRGIPIRERTEQVTAEVQRARKYLEDCLRNVAKG